MALIIKLQRFIELQSVTISLSDAYTVSEKSDPERTYDTYLKAAL